MRSVFLAWGQGFLAVVRAWRVTLLWWMTSLVSALVVAVPVFWILQKHTKHRKSADTLLLRFELSWIADIWSASADTPMLLGVLFVLVAGLFLLLSIFFSAGTVGLFFHKENPATLSFFFQYAGHYFFRFFRVFLVSLLLYGIFLYLYHISIAAWISRTVEESLSEPLVAWATWSKTAGYLTIFGMLYLVMTWVKFSLVVESSAKVLRTTFRMFRLVFRQFGKMLLLCILLAIPTVLLWWGYRRMEPSFSVLSWPSWVGLVALQQGMVWGRGMLRMWFLGSQLQLYLHHNTHEFDESQH